MSERKDGGPAFPAPVDVKADMTLRDVTSGMSLRDWFAGQALSALVSNPETLAALEATAQGTDADRGAVVALAAYHRADAMLSARAPSIKEAGEP
jgi:uncharacterized protein YodC (DUF2158 family)